MSGHLQAVIGYDELRATFIVRDPYRYHETEMLVEPLLQRYRAAGPRGMGLVPVALPSEIIEKRCDLRFDPAPMIS